MATCTLQRMKIATSTSSMAISVNDEAKKGSWQMPVDSLSSQQGNIFANPTAAQVWALVAKREALALNMSKCLSQMVAFCFGGMLETFPR